MVLFKRKPYRIHFVGIGGIGMSGIARLLLNLGFKVSGSDLKETDVTRALAALGGEIRYGHAAENVRDADVVVISSAVKTNNVEVAAARERNLPVIPRAEMLAELMRLKYGIAVAGSHGKTTTASITATVLSGAGLDPTLIIGGKVNTVGSNARLGQSEWLVAEADESDGSFLTLSPVIAIVTNIDREHLDHFKTLERIQEAFLAFVDKIPFYGLAILCIDSPEVQAIIPRVTRRYVTYGLSAQAEYSATDIEYSPLRVSFTVTRRGTALGRLSVALQGAHNVRNVLAAIACAEEIGVPFDAAARALSEFTGVGRRFEIQGEEHGVLVVDDYGHHPSEIAATLDGARKSLHRPITVVFQPHRFTRTRDCFDGFMSAFNDADRVIVVDVYPAGEEPIPGVDSRALYEGLKRHGHRDVRYVAKLDDVPNAILPLLHPGDVVLTCGAGNVWTLGAPLLAGLRAKAEVKP